VLPIGTQMNSYVLELLVGHIVKSHSHSRCADVRVIALVCLRLLGARVLPLSLTRLRMVDPRPGRS
jgi:hypothetical protein